MRERRHAPRGRRPNDASGSGPRPTPAEEPRPARHAWDREQSDVIAMAEEPWNDRPWPSEQDPLVNALMDAAERDSGAPGLASPATAREAGQAGGAEGPELSAQELAHLLDRLDHPLRDSQRLDSAARTSVERAFGASASGLFEIADGPPGGPPPARRTRPPGDRRRGDSQAPASGYRARPAQRPSELLPLAFVALLALLAAASWWWADARTEAAGKRPRVVASQPDAHAPEAERRVPEVTMPAPRAEVPAEAPATSTHEAAATQPVPVAPRAEPERDPSASSAPRPAAARLHLTRKAGPAKVFLGERLLGSAPGDVRLPPGRHLLMIRTPEGISYMRSVRARPGAEIELDLR